MKEQNMACKAMIKRQEVIKKRIFLGLVFQDFMEAYLRQLNFERSALTLTVTIKNDNHYLVFNGFGKQLVVCIYVNGNVEVKVRECNRQEYREQLFEYSNDEDEQAEFLCRLEAGIADAVMDVALERSMSYGSFIDEAKRGISFEDYAA